MKSAIYRQWQARQLAGKKSYALLVDPDKVSDTALDHLLQVCRQAPPACFLVGGSLLVGGDLAACVRRLRQFSPEVPVLLFPGHSLHLCDHADGILLLSLISGRNADFLIGQHVHAAPMLKASGLEILPTAYMLVDCGNRTTAAYMSGTTPLPYDKPDIAACTALAGQMLGLKVCYLDGGSGAKQAVSPEMIAAVRRQLDIPLMVGGGIRTPEQMYAAFAAGADLVVTGTVTEENPDLIRAFADVVSQF
jgi:putative glycerol-1-phosphate prenyltransferase